MKILITGYKGFIGSNLFKKLSERHEVAGFDWGDDFPEISGYDWVIHLGAISATTEKNIERIMIHNYDFSVELYQTCALYGVNLQYASSAQVYGLGTNFKEDAPPDPRSPYAWSKYLFDRYVEQDSIDNMIVQGFRYFNVYGPGDENKGNQSSPFTKFRKQKEELGYIEVFAPAGKYKRDFIHVNDVIDYHIKFFNVEESGIWNIGTGETRSFLDIAEEIGGEVREIPVPDNIRPFYQEWTCADMTKTQATMKRWISG